MLQAIIGLVFIGAVATAILPSSLAMWQNAVSDSVYAELANLRTTINNCYAVTNDLTQCDSNAKLKIVTDGTLQPYAIPSITGITAVITEMFQNAGRGDLCDAVPGVSGVITDTPTGSGGIVTWVRTFSGVLAACQR